MKATRILVVGSAHLDVLASFDPAKQEDMVDVIGGKVEFGFGGTALNIAAWLKDMGHKPFLCTAINKLSFTGQAIHDAMTAGGLSSKHVIDDHSLPDSAFVAHVDATGNRNLHSAVSFMGVSESNRLIDRLRRVVSRCRWTSFARSI